MLAMPITSDEFNEYIRIISNKLATLTEEEEMNILLNCINSCQKRREIYPVFIVEAVISILDCHDMIFNLSPGSKLKN